VGRGHRRTRPSRCFGQAIRYWDVGTVAGGGIESEAGSLSLGSATKPRAARSKAQASAPRRRMDRVGMENVIQLD